MQPHRTNRTCTEAIIAAGISSVVAAMEDPNPKTHGTGFGRLRAAGIEVESGLLEEEAQKTQRRILALDHRTQAVRNAEISFDA